MVSKVAIGGRNSALYAKNSMLPSDWSVTPPTPSAGMIACDGASAHMARGSSDSSRSERGRSGAFRGWRDMGSIRGSGEPAHFRLAGSLEQGFGDFAKPLDARKRSESSLQRARVMDETPLHRV